jgi:hypothetical protein
MLRLGRLREGEAMWHIAGGEHNLYSCIDELGTR